MHKRLAVFAAVVFTVATALRLREIPHGDEPHYLIISQALAKYGSLDPTPVYQHRDYWSYYPRPIDAHLTVGPEGQVVPLHNLGGPLLWLLPFMLFGRIGAHLVIIAVSVLTVVNVFALLVELGVDRRWAAAVTALWTIGTPLYVYSSMLFIEPIGGLLVLYAVRVILAPGPPPWRLALASAGLGYLPLVHGRLSVFTLVLGGLLAIRAGSRPWRLVAAIAPAAVLVASTELFNLTRYGTLNPAPGNVNAGDGLFQVPVYSGLGHLLFDSKYGLLTHFPIVALAVPGFVLARRMRWVTVVLAATVLPYLLAVSTFRSWSGGFAPPARFLAVICPPLAFCAAVTLQRVGHRLLTWLAGAAALGAFAASVATDIRPRARFHRFPDTGQGVLIAACVGGLVALTIAVLVAARRRDGQDEIHESSPGSGHDGGRTPYAAPRAAPDP